MDSEEAVKNFSDLLRDLYLEDIGRIAEAYPREKSLVLDYREIESYSPKLALYLLDYPDDALILIERAIDSLDIPLPGKIHPRVTNLPEDRRLQVRELGAEYVGKLVAVDGIVRQISSTKPRIKRAAWICTQCNHVNYVVQETTVLEKPEVCQNPSCNSRSFVLDLDQSEMVDFQMVEIQEPLEFLRGGEQARFLDIFLEDDLTDLVTPGDRVTFVGILRLSRVKNKNIFSKYLEAVYVERTQIEYEEIEISPEDLEKIKKLASSPDILEKLERSIAPGIYGYPHIKRAIALQLFGGVKKVMGAQRVRGNIHILLMGDPGTGKSQILEYVKNVAPKGIYVAGKTATGVGLTAAAEKDERLGTWVLKAGALVLASGGIACVDEFDKMSKEDRSAMHEAMEQQTVTIAKAGITTRFKTETSILAAANPKYGRFDLSENLIFQVNIEPTLLSRFDLIFFIPEVRDPERDRKIAQHVLKVHTVGEAEAGGVVSEEIEEMKGEIEPAIDKELLRKYVAYARRNVFPVLSEGARKMIEDFYVDLRKKGEKAVPITVRQMEALIRLSEAAARVRLSPVVEERDVRVALDILLKAMEDVMMDRETMTFDVDLVYSGTPMSQREKIKTVMDIIREKTMEYDTVPIEVVVEEAEQRGISRMRAEEIIKKLLEQGEVYQPRHGELKLPERRI